MFHSLDRPLSLEITRASSRELRYPSARFPKKHLGICYHAVREASAAGIWKVGFVQGKINIANCLTKVLSGLLRTKRSVSGCTDVR